MVSYFFLFSADFLKFKLKAMSARINNSLLIVLLSLYFITAGCTKTPPDNEPVKSAPSVTTTAVTDVTTTSAKNGGSVASDGGAAVTSRGICWGTDQNPTTSGSKTTDGSGTGSFTSVITGLAPNTSYYVRAYATNSAGISYGTASSFTTKTTDVLIGAEQMFPASAGNTSAVTLDGESVTCELINGFYIYQRDIILAAPQSQGVSGQSWGGAGQSQGVAGQSTGVAGQSQGVAGQSSGIATKGAGLNLQTRHWPNNRIYYNINHSLPNPSRVTQAINAIKEVSNLEFVVRTGEANYIDFVYDASGCSSFLGMVGGRQDIRLASWGTMGNVIHEICHALGMLHEHSKKGRGSFINIVSANIIEKYAHNFNEFTKSVELNLAKHRGMLLIISAKRLVIRRIYIKFSYINEYFIVLYCNLVCKYDIKRYSI